MNGENDGVLHVLEKKEAPPSDFAIHEIFSRSLKNRQLIASKRSERSLDEPLWAGFGFDLAN